MFKVRRGGGEEIPLVQSKRNPSKMVGVARGHQRAPGDLANPGIKIMSPAWQADSSPSESPGKPTVEYYSVIKRMK